MRVPGPRRRGPRRTSPRRREKALAFVAGKSVDEIVAVGEEIYDELMAAGSGPAPGRSPSSTSTPGSGSGWSPRRRSSWPGSSPRRLGLTGALGTVAEVEDGLYTGRLVGELLHGPAKAEAVRALAEREGLDLARCTAYSDSTNDVPMLSLVGHAVAVNPDTALRDEARPRGWDVRDFRTGRKAAKIGVPTAAGARRAGRRRRAAGARPATAPDRAASRLAAAVRRCAAAARADRLRRRPSGAA